MKQLEKLFHAAKTWLIKDAQPLLLHEIGILTSSIKKTRYRIKSRREITFELITNGISAIITLGVTSLLNKLFVVPSIKNLWGIAKKKDTFLISKDTYEVLSWVLLFFIGIVVFTYIEHIIENYLTERESKPLNKSK